MKKLRVVLGAAAVLLAAFFLLTRETPPCRPHDGSLEFWIGDHITEEELRGRETLPGGGDSVIFYGTGYQKEEPRRDVLFSACPCRDGDFVITRIEATDPAVRFFGLTPEASPEELQCILVPMGYTVREEPDGLTARKSGIAVTLKKGEPPALLIAAESPP